MTTTWTMVMYCWCLGREDDHCLYRSHIHVFVRSARSIIYNSFRCNSRRNRPSIYAPKHRNVDMETSISGRPSRPRIVSTSASKT